MATTSIVIDISIEMLFYLRYHNLLLISIQVKSLRLVGIFLLVYIQTKHMKYVSEVEAESVPTGIMGMVVSIDPNNSDNITCINPVTNKFCQY